MKLLSKLLGIYIATVGAAHVGFGATVLTFDDLAGGAPSDTILQIVPNGYGGLNWYNFAVLNTSSLPATYGYRTGTVSPENVAFNPFGDPASISSPNAFDLNSAYLTAALNLDTPLQIEVQGFVGNTLTYDHTYTVNRFAPTLINFNYTGVDQVKFISSAQEFAMDNLTVSAVPEPTTCAFWSVGAALSMLGVLKGKIKSSPAGSLSPSTA